jgi:hypothetical protein
MFGSFLAPVEFQLAGAFVYLPTFDLPTPRDQLLDIFKINQQAPDPTSLRW